MIKRIWHGWTTPGNADKYEQVLNEHVFPAIEEKNMPGYRGIELLRRDGETEVEFITIMTFESLQDVIAFQGQDIHKSYVPGKAREVLSRWDTESAHFEVRESRSYGS